MQLPELFRQGIVRPLDDAAAAELAAQEVRTPIRVEWLPIPDQEQFDRIWAAGVFQQVGAAGGIEITDYEEAELKAEKIPAALAALQSLEYPDAETARFVQGLRALLTEAAADGRCGYFVL